MTNFEHLEKLLKVQIVVNKLSNDFDILTKLKIILKKLCLPSYS